MQVVEPPTDVARVVEEEIREWHFHIYFFQHNSAQHAAALALRDAVLRLRRDGAFVAVPLFRVNTEPIGPHPAAKVSFRVLSMGPDRLTEISSRDHEFRNAWMGPSFPLDLSKLPIRSEEIPLQYPLLKLGYSRIITGPSIEERKAAGRKIEETLRREKEAAPAPKD
ncbi:DOPA 4,5-dioxygenase [Ceratobasidium theobromae]|uniref:DOPA 4,5-dioxygenase n=1 Tax=Ceratobasidium theobromae TaxID=1582974 RepID=A0A5N5QVI6_9AGAM|nr:DOPA 4,5-dioxygenase [Ceratobasidium theobromae]